MQPLFFFGAMSPYSWFAAERIGELIPGARWVPVYAGALFASNRRSSWGLGERRAAGLADCEARSAAYGLGPIRWPEPWPTNDVLAARAMVFANQCGRLRDFALAAMRLAFQEGGELADPSVVAIAGARAGLDPGELAAAVASPEVKAALRANNDRALGHGVFGVPTVVVGTDLFWGDDRLDEAARADGRRII